MCVFYGGIVFTHERPKQLKPPTRGLTTERIFRSRLIDFSRGEIRAAKAYDDWRQRCYLAYSFRRHALRHKLRESPSRSMYHTSRSNANSRGIFHVQWNIRCDRLVNRSAALVSSSFFLFFFATPFRSIVNLSLYAGCVLARSIHAFALRAMSRMATVKMLFAAERSLHGVTKSRFRPVKYHSDDTADNTPRRFP